MASNKNKLYKTLGYWSRDMLDFDFLKKGLEMAFSPHFVYYFSRKRFLLLYSINWPNFIAWLPDCLIAWLPLLLAILDNMCIRIACFAGCDVIIFEINLISLIKPFFYMTKSSRQKIKYLSRAITAERSAQHITDSRTRIGNL